MRKVLFFLGLMAGVGCATSGTPASTPAGASETTTPSAGSSGLPDFELTSIDGEQVRLSDYLGKQVVLLSFWATWCEPCKTEMPHLNQIYSAHKAEGLMVLSIAMDDPTTVAQVTPLAKRTGLNFPVLLDTNTRAANLYNTHKSAPFTVVIDRGGKIVSATAGYEPGSEIALEQEIVGLLRQPQTR